MTKYEYFNLDGNYRFIVEWKSKDLEIYSDLVNEVIINDNGVIEIKFVNIDQFLEIAKFSKSKFVSNLTKENIHDLFKNPVLPYRISDLSLEGDKIAETTWEIDGKTKVILKFDDDEFHLKFKCKSITKKFLV